MLRAAESTFTGDYHKLGKNPSHEHANHAIVLSIVVSALLLSSATSFVLLGLYIQGWRSSEDIAIFITQHRTSVAILVQVASQILGMLQLTALCERPLLLDSKRHLMYNLSLGSIIRLSFASFASKPGKRFSLNSLHFLSTASSQSIAWSLPWPLVLGLLSCATLAVAPSALWSGALTPVSTYRKVEQTVLLPTFNISNPANLFIGDTNLSSYISGAAGYGQWLTPQGLFSFDSNAMRGLTLHSASQASSGNATGHFHTKLDKTGFNFVNRSFGAGGPVGLMATAGNQNPMWISYDEFGFYSTISCEYNYSTAFVLEESFLPINDWGVYVFISNGTLQNGAQADQVVYTASSEDGVFAWDVQSEDKAIYLSIRTPANASDDEWAFADFDAIQCRIDFVTRHHTVLANYTDMTIQVTPGDEYAWLDYASTVIFFLSNQLRLLSAEDDASVSEIGRSMRLNIDILQNSTEIWTNQTLLEGVQDFMASMVDDCLVTLTATQLIATNLTMPMAVQIGVQAIVLGDQKYIYGVAALSLVLWLVFAIEAYRNRTWSRGFDVDFTDPRFLLISSLKGGAQISTTFRRSSGSRIQLLESKDLKLRLQRDRQAIPAIVPIINDTQQLLIEREGL